MWGYEGHWGFLRPPVSSLFRLLNWGLTLPLGAAPSGALPGPLPHLVLSLDTNPHPHSDASWYPSLSLRWVVLYVAERLFLKC